jgi:hypothetical protein
MVSVICSSVLSTLRPSHISVHFVTEQVGSNGNRSDLYSAGCPIRTSSEAVIDITEVLRGFPESFHSNAGRPSTLNYATATFTYFPNHY